MALKKSLTKEQYEALPEVLKAEYKADGDNFVLDVEGDEDVGALKRAKDHEKEQRKNTEKALKEAQEKLAQIADEKARAAGDVVTLEKSWQQKYDQAMTEASAKVDKLAGQLKKQYVDNEAIKLANELSKTAPKLILPHIMSRLQVDFEGDEPKTRVLDANGQISAMTLDDLKKEFVANKDFSAIITQTNASGSSKGDDKKPNQSGGAAKKSDKLLADMKPEELLEHMNSKAG